MQKEHNLWDVQHVGKSVFLFIRYVDLWSPRCCRRRNYANREFKKLRRQLQRKHHTKIELCVKFSVVRLFHVGHVVQNRPRVLWLAWHESFSCKGHWRMKDLLLRARAVVRTPYMKILLCRLVDYVKKLHKKMCRTCSTIIFLLRSTNQIIDLWRCRCRLYFQKLGSFSTNDGNGNDNAIN